MEYFTDSKFVNFEDLRKVVNEDGKRIYSERLIQGIENGDLNYLYEIDVKERNNKFFMEPLIYAVKHNSRLSTYEVYRYCGEEVQKNLEIAEEVAINEPEVIEGTAVSNDDTIMLHLAEINPEVILYASDDLINDGEFIEALCKTGNREAIMYAAQECNISEVLQDNPNLASNPVFMKEAIKEDATVLGNLPEDLRNNYEFIKEVAQENEKVIDYVAEHTEEFGKEAISATKEVLTENTTCRAIDEFQTELEKVQEEIARVESQEGFDKESKEYKDLLLRKRHAEHGIKFMDRIRNMEDPRRALELIDRLCVGKSEEYKQDLIKYFKLDDAVIAKEKSQNKIKPQDIEEKSQDAKLSEVQEETGAIRNEITAEREVQEKNGEEIGE